MTIRARLAERMIADGLVVAAIAGWWLLSLRLPDFLMPGPWQVATRLVDLFVTPSLLADVAASAARVAAVDPTVDRVVHAEQQSGQYVSRFV